MKDGVPRHFRCPDCGCLFSSLYWERVYCFHRFDNETPHQPEWESGIVEDGHHFSEWAEMQPFDPEGGTMLPYDRTEQLDDLAWYTVKAQIDDRWAKSNERRREVAEKLLGVLSDEEEKLLRKQIRKHKKREASYG